MLCIAGVKINFRSVRRMWKFWLNSPYACIGDSLNGRNFLFQLVTTKNQLACFRLVYTVLSYSHSTNRQGGQAIELEQMILA